MDSYEDGGEVDDEMWDHVGWQFGDVKSSIWTLKLFYRTQEMSGRGAGWWTTVTYGTALEEVWQIDHGNLSILDIQNASNGLNLSLDVVTFNQVHFWTSQTLNRWDVETCLFIYWITSWMAMKGRKEKEPKPKGCIQSWHTQYFSFLMCVSNYVCR